MDQFETGQYDPWATKLPVDTELVQEQHDPYLHQEGPDESVSIPVEPSLETEFDDTVIHHESENYGALHPDLYADAAHENVHDNKWEYAVHEEPAYLIGHPADDWLYEVPSYNEDVFDAENHTGDVAYEDVSPEAGNDGPDSEDDFLISESNNAPSSYPDSSVYDVDHNQHFPSEVSDADTGHDDIQLSFLNVQDDWEQPLLQSDDEQHTTRSIQDTIIRIPSTPFVSKRQQRAETFDPKNPHYRYKDELIDVDQLEPVGGRLSFWLETLTLLTIYKAHVNWNDPSVAGWKRFFHGFFPPLYALLYSKQDEYPFYKALLGFPLGVGLGLLFYYAVVDRLSLPVFLRFMLGAMTITTLALGYARSIRMRCIAWLIFPCFCGKSGRSVLMTMAVGALLTGPVSNTMGNFKESVRCVTCMTEMMINITLTRFELTGKPIFNIVKGFVGDKRMDRLGRKIRSALSPVRKEVESEKETREAEIRAQRLDAESRTNRHDFLKKMEKQHAVALAKTDGGTKSKAFKVDTSYLKKLDYRCNDIWSLAVDSCKKSFANAWDNCLKAIPVIGYLLCWPTKLDFFCYIVKLFPNPVKCDSSKILNQGFGGAYGEGDEAGQELQEGTEVALEYKIRPKPGKVDAVNINDMKQGLKSEFSKKQRFFNFVITIFQRILAFMFVRIFITCFQYQNRYLNSIRYDNYYITDYFRKIERRRREKNRARLIPLKKLEAKVLIESTKWKLLPEEQQEFSKGSMRLVINALTFLIVFLFDRLIYEILSIVARHSYIVYTQKGVHDISLQIKGGGVLAKLVKKILKGFHERTEINRTFDNLKCLPYPTLTPASTYYKVFGTVGLVWLLIYFEAYGLRLRSWICAFFYPKREKQRILHLYNDTLKKRKGYARTIRHHVRRLARQRTLQMQYDMLSALREQCPYLCFWLQWLRMGKKRCTACKEKEEDDFYHCPTPGCSFEYCPSCWEDLRYHCYGCTPETDDESSLSEGEYNSDKDRTEAD